MILRSHDDGPREASGQGHARNANRHHWAQSTRPRATVIAHGRKVALRASERHRFRRVHSAAVVLGSDHVLRKAMIPPKNRDARPGGSGPLGATSNRQKLEV